jgi:hypothetical protein
MGNYLSNSYFSSSTTVFTPVKPTLIINLYGLISKVNHCKRRANKLKKLSHRFHIKNCHVYLRPLFKEFLDYCVTHFQNIKIWLPKELLSDDYRELIMEKIFKDYPQIEQIMINDPTQLQTINKDELLLIDVHQPIASVKNDVLNASCFEDKGVSANDMLSSQFIKNSVPVTQFEVNKSEKPSDDTLLLYLTEYLELFNKLYYNPNVGKGKVSETLTHLEPFDKWYSTQSVKIKVNKNLNQNITHTLNEDYTR